MNEMVRLSLNCLSIAWIPAVSWVPAGAAVSDFVVSNPILVPNVNSDANEGGPSISAAMLAIFFNSDAPAG
jgi:hypothetical protein